MKDIFKKITENRQMVTLIAVVALSAITIGISYAAFYTVKGGSGTHTITTGTLSVSYDGGTSTLSEEEILPLPDVEGLEQTDSKEIVVENTGNIASSYTLTIGHDLASFKSNPDYEEIDVLTPVEYIKVAVFAYDSTTGTETLVTGPTTIGELPIYEIDTKEYRNNRYTLLTGLLGPSGSDNDSITYRLKVWLSDEATPFASGTFFYIDSELIATAAEAQMSYTLSGTLVDETGIAISNADVEIPNASMGTTTDASGNFTLPDVPLGTYNIIVRNAGKTYDANITLKEGSNINVTDLGSSITPSSTTNIFVTAYTYGTTISKIITMNNLDGVSQNIVLKAGNTYKMAPSFLITGAYEKEISNLKMTANSTTNLISLSN